MQKIQAGEAEGVVDLNPSSGLYRGVVFIKYYEGAFINGTVMIADGAPLPNATVTVLDEYGKVQPTISDFDFGNAVTLEASRLGTDRDGRLYTITVKTYDYAGNMASKNVFVLVPHDMGTNTIQTATANGGIVSGSFIIYNTYDPYLLLKR